MTFHLRAILLGCTLVTMTPSIAMERFGQPVSDPSSAPLPANLQKAIAPFKEKRQQIEKDIETIQETIHNIPSSQAGLEQIIEFLNTYKTNSAAIFTAPLPNKSLLETQMIEAFSAEHGNAYRDGLTFSALATASEKANKIKDALTSPEMKEALRQAYNTMVAPENQKYESIRQLKEWGEKYVSSLFNEMRNAGIPFDPAAVAPETRVSAPQPRVDLFQYRPDATQFFVNGFIEGRIQQFTLYHNNDSTVLDLKETLASRFRVDPNKLAFVVEGRATQDNQTLNSLDLGRRQSMVDFRRALTAQQQPVQSLYSDNKMRNDGIPFDPAAVAPETRVSAPQPRVDLFQYHQGSAELLPFVGPGRTQITMYYLPNKTTVQELKEAFAYRQNVDPSRVIFMLNGTVPQDNKILSDLDARSQNSSLIIRMDAPSAAAQSTQTWYSNTEVLKEKLRTSPFFTTQNDQNGTVFFLNFPLLGNANYSLSMERDATVMDMRTIIAKALGVTTDKIIMLDRGGIAKDDALLLKLYQENNPRVLFQG